MRIHILQHEKFEGPGYIEDWIRGKNHELTYTRFYENSELPASDGFDFLIIMGGSMSVNDEQRFPWLKQEKQFIKSAIENGKIVLGICLGAQLIASSLGKKVFPNLYKEIGWFEITLTPEAKGNKLFDFFPNETNVFHWHGDTFDLPDNATHIAASQGCRNQAFVYKDKVIGLQFHIEATESLLRSMAANGLDELVEDKYIQTEEQLLNGIRFCRQNNTLLKHLLNRLEEEFFKS